MKKIGYILIFLNGLFGQCQKQGFALQITVDQYFSGYVYLAYDDKIDSSLVVNKQLNFKGILEKNVANASLFKKGEFFRIDKPLYIENTVINIVTQVEKKKVKIKDTLTTLKIKSIIGSRTSDIYTNYEIFKKQHEEDPNYTLELLKKVDSIVTTNPKNTIASDLLFKLLLSDQYDNQSLEKIYMKIDKDFQGYFAMRKIENHLFPQNFVTTNQPIYNFVLPNENDIAFDTQTLKGKWILIDFWASWCAGCLEQFPQLRNIYGSYKDKNFEIVSVSIDKMKTDWKATLAKENLNWINLIEGQGTSGPVATKYNLFGVPKNFLIDSEGSIIAENITLELLEKVLQGR